MKFSEENLKPGDKVLLKEFDSNFKNDYFGLDRTDKKKSKMAKWFGTEVTVASVFNTSFDIEDDGGSWSWNYKWIEKKIKKDTEQKSKYSLVKPITLKEIKELGPYQTEFERFCNELLECGYSFNDIVGGEITFNEEIFDYETVQDNIKWALEKGLIEEEKEFEPFDITFKIESKEMLQALYGTVTTAIEYRSGYDDDKGLRSIYEKYVLKLFNPVVKEMHRVE